MNGEVLQKYKISPILFFFLMYISIVDIGIMGFQSLILKYAGTDAWISVGLTGITAHLIVWMIYKILATAGGDNPDLVEINRICFGPLLGRLLDVIFILYLILGAVVAFRSYQTLVQVWLFPTMPIWPLSLTIVILLYYTVKGGLRAVNGLSFWGILASFFCVSPMLFMVIPYLHPINLKPVWSHSTVEMLMSSKSMSQQYLGIESIFMVYPFLKKPSSSQKWAQCSLLVATLVFMALAVITFMFYSEGQLKLLVWPTLHILMVLQIPFFQSLEYLVISIFFLPIVVNIALSLWMACRAVKRSFNIKQHIWLLICLLIILVSSILIKDYDRLKPLMKIYGEVGFYLLYVYVPVVYLWIKVRKNRSRPTS